MSTEPLAPDMDPADATREDLMVGLYPLRFEPILKRLLWGGRRLGSHLGKPIGEEGDFAESWEISDHRSDVSRVAHGPLAGADLRTLLAERPEELLGPGRGDAAQFPLLVKFLDANLDLSVQVHPDDARGRRLVDDNGKTEAWIVMHAEPGSLIYAGLREGVTREAFARAIEAGAVEPLLHRIEPTRGDCIFIPAGTIHAIGAGVIVAEVQQMSDATFRVHDWGRVGADGKPRALHVAESMECIDFDAGPVQPVRGVVEPIAGGTRERLVRCPYFRLDRLEIDGRAEVGSEDGFTILIGLEGAANVLHDGDRHALACGETLLLPAAIGRCVLESNGPATVLACSVC